MEINFDKSTKKQIVEHFYKCISESEERIKYLLLRNRDYSNKIDNLSNEINKIKEDVVVCDRILLDVETMASSFCEDSNAGERSRRLFNIIVNFIQKNRKGTK